MSSASPASFWRRIPSVPRNAGKHKEQFAPDASLRESHFGNTPFSGDRRARRSVNSGYAARSGIRSLRGAARSWGGPFRELGWQIARFGCASLRGRVILGRVVPGTRGGRVAPGAVRSGSGIAPGAGGWQIVSGIGPLRKAGRSGISGLRAAPWAGRSGGRPLREIEAVGSESFPDHGAGGSLQGSSGDRNGPSLQGIGRVAPAGVVSGARGGRKTARVGSARGWIYVLNHDQKKMH